MIRRASFAFALLLLPALAFAGTRPPETGPGGVSPLPPVTAPSASAVPLPPAPFAPPAFRRGAEVMPLGAEPIHTEEFIVLKDRLPSGRDRVAVDVFRPPSPGPHAAVVILHGTHGPGRAEKYYLRLSEDLARHGYIGLFVRYYDRGRRGKGSRAQWAKTIGDTLTFAAALPEADPDRMALIGYSQGAFLALNDAPSDRRIRAVVAYYGGLSPGFFPQAEEDMPPTLLFHGTADRIVPVRRSIETLRHLRDAGHPADLIIYPGAVHGFNLNSLPGPDAFAAEDSWARTLAFLDFHLRYPAWTPAVLPLGQTGTSPFGQPPLARAAIPYLAPPDAGAAGQVLIDPSSQDLDEILKHAPPPRGHHAHRGKARRGHAGRKRPPAQPPAGPILP